MTRQSNVLQDFAMDDNISVYGGDDTSIDEIPQLISPAPQQRSALSDRYFLVRCTPEDIVTSQQYNAYFIRKDHPLRSRLLQAFSSELYRIILVFYVELDDTFGGTAQMTSNFGSVQMPADWPEPDWMCENYGVDWINKTQLSREETNHLHNPWQPHEGAISDGCDLQEIMPEAAKKLSDLMRQTLKNNIKALKMQQKQIVTVVPPSDYAARLAREKLIPTLGWPKLETTDEVDIFKELPVAGGAQRRIRTRKQHKEIPLWLRRAKHSWKNLQRKEFVEEPPVITKKEIVPLSEEQMAEIFS